jgi:DNA-binding transcriptional MocR family regulator
MDRHAALLAPKFAAVDAVLRRRLGGTGLASWTRPQGGYFFSLDVADGCAAEVVRLADAAGLALTPAGATFPYGRDPRDRNLRLAPTYPPLEELKQATEILCSCVELAAARKAARA